MSHAITIPGGLDLLLCCMLAIIAIIGVLFLVIVQQKLKEILDAFKSVPQKSDHQELVAEMTATKEGIAKLHQDMRLAFYDSTTCGDCGAGFEYPTRLSGKETNCPHCTLSIKLPN